MSPSPTAKTNPLSRKRTERLSPEPGDTGPDSKRARALAPSQSFANVLEDMPTNDPSLAGPHPRGFVDLDQALVFQLVDARQHSSNRDLVLLFGITKTDMRIMVHITNLSTLMNLGGEVRRYPRAAETFLRHYKIPAMSWLELPAGKYEMVNAAEALSHNQTEVKIKHNDFVVQENQSRGAMPRRILGFDIETRVPPDNSFTQYHETAKMPVIQIGNIVEMEDSRSSYRVIFTLGECSGIPRTRVNSYTDEASMLLAWRQFVIDSDPDLVVGHNIARFDFVYLILRAEALCVADFACLGRLRGVNAIARKSPFSTMRAWHEAPVLAGRLQLDTYQYIQERRARNNLPTRPGQFTLNAVCGEFLVNEKKEDINFKSINALQDGTNDQRKELAIYCLKDSYLPLRLLDCDALKCLDEATKAAQSERFLHLPFSDFLRCGRNT
ncbi:ribonuclease H-like domain-containing protein [Mycena vitilis]|nr:ribonuclease H-like domain-containing protein [Mycena vitilis]